MQLTSIFTLLPLLAMMVAATPYDQPQQQSSAVNGPQQNSAYGEPLYQQDDDQGDYHNQPANSNDSEEQVDDERVYDKQPDSRAEDDSYAPVSPTKTVVIVVAKSQHSSTSTRTILTTTGSGSSNQSISDNDNDDSHGNYNGNASKVQYVTPKGRPLTPATSATMFPINRTLAIRNNYKENRHIKKNKLYPAKTKCLTVRRHGLRNRFRAVLEHCDDDQRFWLRSPMSFHFEDAGEDTVVLTWMDPKGVKRCARHQVSGTRFYPCNDKKEPTRYEIIPTKYQGKFKVKQHKHDHCFDFVHSTLWMNKCRHFKDQAIDFVTIAYDQN